MGLTDPDRAHGDGQSLERQAPRRSTIADLGAITRVIRAAYEVYLDRMDRPPAPVLRDYRREAGSGAIWVLGDPVVAVLVLVPGTDSLLVENIAVDPVAQGTGHGRRLMEFAEEQAVALGVSRITLYTNEVMVENLAFYTRLGYREVTRGVADGYRRVFLEKPLGTAGCGKTACPGNL